MIGVYENSCNGSFGYFSRGSTWQRQSNVQIEGSPKGDGDGRWTNRLVRFACTKGDGSGDGHQLLDHLTRIQSQINCRHYRSLRKNASHQPIRVQRVVSTTGESQIIVRMMVMVMVIVVAVIVLRWWWLAFAHDNASHFVLLQFFWLFLCPWPWSSIGCRRRPNWLQVAIPCFSLSRFRFGRYTHTHTHNEYSPPQPYPHIRKSQCTWVFIW